MSKGFLLGAIALVALLCYANNLGSPFFADDHLLVETSDYVRSPDPLIAFRINLFGLTGNAAAESTLYYRPLPQISYFYNFHLAGSSAPAFHAVNVICHLGMS